MLDKSNRTIPFKISSKDKKKLSSGKKHTWKSGKVKYSWDDNLDRINIVREGLPYYFIENISHKLNMPIKNFLIKIGMPQTTYNKKKNENSLLDSHNSELLVLIFELLTYGKEVFNHDEDKFLRWLEKPNISLGGKKPESFLDTVSGINVIRNTLKRLDYGNLA